MSQPTTQPQQSGGMMGGLGSTIMTGMAFGAGSEIAHQAVRSVVGGGNSHNQPQQQEHQDQQQNNITTSQPQQQQQNPCMEHNSRFVNCLQKEGNEISNCQSFFDELKFCEKNMFR
jgi:hypothetical protein